MEADKFKEGLGEEGLEQLKDDLAIQEAVDRIVDAAIESDAVETTVAEEQPVGDAATEGTWAE